MLSTWRTGSSQSPLAQFHLSLESFDGPFDLLIQLIESQGFDITSVSLMAVTSQYLEYVVNIGDRGAFAEASSEFLVVATQLLLLKSRALLPGPADQQEELEDAGALANRLRVYSAYRRLAQELGRIQDVDMPAFVRLAAPLALAPQVYANGGDLGELAAALLQMLRPGEEHEIQVRLPTARFEMRERIAQVLGVLSRSGPLSFAEIAADCESKLEIIYTFLAVLYLVARRSIDVRQRTPFGSITLSAAGGAN